MYSKYPHRTNPDGTIDSICPRCYATIGTSILEQDLELPEAEHVCDPTRLRYFEEQAERKPVQSEDTLSKPEHQYHSSVGRYR